MGARPIHRVLGAVLLLPMAGWCMTALFFFFKPGWDAAYGPARVKTLPLEDAAAGAHGIAGPGALEVRRLRTSLGEHLLVRTGAGWEQRDPASGAARPRPDPQTLKPLFDEIAANDPGRYGVVTSLKADGSDGATAATSTGASLSLDWATLSVSQRGRDTDRIDGLYRIHYLQWTGVAAIDRPLGLIGISALALLAALGARLIVK